MGQPAGDRQNGDSAQGKCDMGEEEWPLAWSFLFPNVAVQWGVTIEGGSDQPGMKGDKDQMRETPPALSMYIREMA